jgi:hypothetical protein
MSTFLIAVLVLKFGHLGDTAGNVLFGIAAIAAILLYTVRCERCKKMELVYRFSGPSKSFGDLLMPPKKCPNCGLERV